MQNHMLSFGHGYSAQALARVLIPLGWRVTGTTRNPEKAERMQAAGVTPLLWDEAGHIKDALGASTHVLVSAGPDAQGDPVLRDFGPDIKARARQFEWVGYLSTTGVYGDHQGQWVDENAPLTPATKRGIARVEAEAQWQNIPELKLHIFRLAGIYGPGRGPFSKVKNGTARRIIKKNQVFSRIHVDDIAQVLQASINRPRSGAVYNVCDDYPAPPQDVIAHAAELLGMPLPPAVKFEEAEMTPMARSFYAESKKVNNDLIKTELGVSLRYRDYRQGLAALLRL